MTTGAASAHTLYKRDVNYLIEDDKVIIVDEFTGRKMPGRRWSDGLHQAIEAKEGVEVQEENQTMATISYQNYFRIYKKLAGMTGTADTEAEEFHKIYKLDVTVVPTNKPMLRKDTDDVVYKNERGKFRAVVDEIVDCHKRGQPVLVGTVSVEKSEVVASLLRKKQIPHNVLNAKQHEKEAHVVAQAGRKGAVTISTNMAGRGTDIILGGNAEFMARAEIDPENAGKPGHEWPPEQEEAFQQGFARFKAQCDAEKQEVLAAGGLHILGTERHESRRIDNQLRGRSGRQGDPGSSRFFLSLEDDLMRIFGAERITGLMERLGMEEDVPIEHGLINRAIENAQKKVEGHNFDIRKNLLEYDDVMNQQRKTIYALRRQVLEGRYAPEPTEEEKKKGKTSADMAVPTESGKHTAETPREVGAAGAGAHVRGADRGAHGRPEFARRLRGREGGPAAGLPALGDLPVVRRLSRYERRRRGSDRNARSPGRRGRLVDDPAARAAAGPVRGDAAGDRRRALSAQRARRGLGPRRARAAIKERFNFEPTIDETKIMERETLVKSLWDDIETMIEAREAELQLPGLLFWSRRFFLQEIDERWIDHLKSMEALREGIGLRGYGQKDPKQEYKKEGFVIFGEMMGSIGRNVCEKLFHMQVQRDESAASSPSSPSSAGGGGQRGGSPAAAPQRKPRRTIESGGGAEPRAASGDGKRRSG